MIIWPRQLRAINELVEERPTQTVEVISLPLRIRCTVSYKDGTWKTVDINHDGETSEIFGSESGRAQQVY